MATSSNFLNLVLPGKGEFVDSWDEPLNENAVKIDSFALGVDDELSAARFSEASLADFLAIAHEGDGTLKPTAEVEAARSSTVYGDKDQTLDTPFSLDRRLEEGDLDVHGAKEGESSLRNALAARALVTSNMIFSGSANVNGTPSWLGFTADKANVDGGSEVINLLIDGYRSRIRILEQVTFAGAAQTYFLFAQFQLSGVLRVNGDPAEAGPPTPPGVATGITSNDADTVPRILSDVTKDFTALDVQPGDKLEIVGGNDAGIFIIKDVAPDGNVDQLRIWGRFPVGGLSSQSYTVRDPLAVVLGFDSTETPAAGKHYIGEVDFDGAAVTAVRPRHFKDAFVGDWRAVDVSGSPSFEEIWDHQLGTQDLDIIVQASQTNDGSSAAETLSEALLANTLGFTGSVGSLAIQNDAPIHTDPILSAGDQTISTPGSVAHNVQLNGVPGGSITGDILPNRSVRSKYSNNQLWVKNAVPSVFYKDYDDNDRQTGFVRVIVRKRG